VSSSRPNAARTLAVRAAIPVMRRQGGGRVVNVVGNDGVKCYRTPAAASPDRNGFVSSGFRAAGSAVDFGAVIARRRWATRSRSAFCNAYTTRDVTVEPSARHRASFARHASPARSWPTGEKRNADKLL
jgi:hypothetical protein